MSSNIDKHFRHLAKTLSGALGSAYWFFGCILVLVLWLMAGPFLDFSIRWQVTIHTIILVFVFVSVMLRSNSAQADADDTHAKLDALLIANNREDLAHIERERVRKHIELSTPPTD